MSTVRTKDVLEFLVRVVLSLAISAGVIYLVWRWTSQQSDTTVNDGDFDTGIFAEDSGRIISPEHLGDNNLCVVRADGTIEVCHNCDGDTNDGDFSCKVCLPADTNKGEL